MVWPPPQSGCALDRVFPASSILFSKRDWGCQGLAKDSNQLIILRMSHCPSQESPNPSCRHLLDRKVPVKGGDHLKTSDNSTRNDEEPDNNKEWFMNIYYMGAIFVVQIVAYALIVRWERKKVSELLASREMLAKHLNISYNLKSSHISNFATKRAAVLLFGPLAGAAAGMLTNNSSVKSSENIAEDINSDIIEDSLPILGTALSVVNAGKRYWNDPVVKKNKKLITEYRDKAKGLEERHDLLLMLYLLFSGFGYFVLIAGVIQDYAWLCLILALGGVLISTIILGAIFGEPVPEFYEEQ